MYLSSNLYGNWNFIKPQLSVINVTTVPPRFSDPGGTVVYLIVINQRTIKTNKVFEHVYLNL